MTDEELAFERKFVHDIIDSKSCLLNKNKLKQLIEEDFPIKKNVAHQSAKRQTSQTSSKLLTVLQGSSSTENMVIKK